MTSHTSHYINISCTIPDAHGNITASFLKLYTRPTHSQIVFPQPQLNNGIGLLNSQTLFQATQYYNSIFLNKYLIDH